MAQSSSGEEKRNEGIQRFFQIESLLLYNPPRQERRSCRGLLVKSDPEFTLRIPGKNGFNLLYMKLTFIPHTLSYINDALP